MKTRRPPSPMAKVPTDIPGKGKGGHVATGPGAGSSAGFFPPGGGGAPASSRTVDVPVPWNVRPPGSREINVDASATGFNAANTPAVIPGSAFVVPAENVGILRSVILSLNNMVPATAVTWTFRANGIAIEGWSQLTIFPRNAGYAAQAFDPGETWIPLDPNITIDVVVTVLDANTYDMGVTYHGWSYPKGYAAQFENLYRG